MDIVVDPDPVPSVTLKRAHEQEEGGEREEGGLGSPFKIARTDDGGDSSSASPEPPAGPSKLEQLVAGLEDELWCPLCAAVLYGPVIISPCSHIACGACLSRYLQVTQPKPHACPSCRGTATSATHSRTLGGLVDLLILHAPEKERAQGERDQADEEWAVGEALRFGNPPLPPSIPRPSEVYRRCRYCDLGNGLGYNCPIPVPPPDSALAYPLDGPCPEGHLSCSSCSQLAAMEAPSTLSCGVCEAGYCGLTQASCTPSLFASTKPGGSWGQSSLSLSDSIFDPPVDELSYAFKDNVEELRIFAEFVQSHPELTPAKLYSEIIGWTLTDEGKEKGGVRGIFRRVDEGLHSNLNDTKVIERMCLPCSDDLFACGMYEWWARRRPLVINELDKVTRSKPDCKNGRSCYRQGNAAHVRKWNHICAALPEDIAASIEQDDHPLPVSPPAVVRSSPAPEIEMDAPANEGVGRQAGSNPSSVTAVENVGMGIGNLQASDAVEIDSSDEEDEDGERPQMVSVGVQTGDVPPPVVLEDEASAGGDEPVFDGVVEEPVVAGDAEVVKGDAEVVDAASDPANLDFWIHQSPSAPHNDEKERPLSPPFSFDPVQEPSVAVVEEEDAPAPVVAAEATSSSNSNFSSPIADSQPAAVELKVCPSVQVQEAEESDDDANSEADRTLVGNVSPSLFKDMSIEIAKAESDENGQDVVMA